MKQFLAGFLLTLAILIFMDIGDVNVIEIIKDNTPSAWLLYYRHS